MQELVQYAQWIEESLSSIRKKDVKAVFYDITIDEKGKKRWVLKEDEDLSPMILSFKAGTVLAQAVCDHGTLTSAAASIGDLVLMGKTHPDTPLADKMILNVNLGMHLINVLIENKKIKERRGIKERDPYTISVLDDVFVDNIVYSINANPLPIKLHTKPIFDEPAQFKGFYNKVAGELVHKINPEVKQHFTYDNCPIVFDAINKHMGQPLQVNTDFLAVLDACKEDPIMTFRGKGYDEEQFIGVKREQSYILDIARGVGSKVFYQNMFYDFRGRLYSSLIYFNPQGSKMAKGLIKFAETAPMGLEGLGWLKVHIANCWGYDKKTLEEREKFVDNNWRKGKNFRAMAVDPINNKAWQKSDSPFEFLPAIMELQKANDHPGGPEEYPSGLMVAWDATCSGLQVLSAITRDKKSGHLCNLTNSGKRGDYYQMIADDIWGEFKYTEADTIVFDEVIAKLDDFANKVEKIKSKSKRKEIFLERKEWSEENREKLRTASRVYWGRPHIVEKARKIVKRPCMTYFYSCQAKTMAKSLFSDFRNEGGFESLHMTFCLYLTSRIYASCQKNMPIATQMMDAFIDMGLKDYDNGKDFTLAGPYNNFMLMQNYRNPLSKEVRFKIGNRSIRLKVYIGRGENLDYAKIKSATSPNAVHMLDSQIVSAVIMNADYPINCVHDSFATRPADAGSLFEDTRKCFVNIFNQDLLVQFELDKGIDTEIELGDLDLFDSLDDDYIFS